MICVLTFYITKIYAHAPFTCTRELNVPFVGRRVNFPTKEAAVGSFEQRWVKASD